LAKSNLYVDEIKRFEGMRSKKDAEIAALTAERLGIETIIAELHKLAAQAGVVIPTEPESKLPQLELDLRVNTATMEGAAIIALEKVGRPLRLREIWDALVMLGYRYPKGFEKWKGSISPSLRKNPQVTRPGVGLYGLPRWSQEQPATWNR
jgi:hypothetical protein